MEIAWYLFYPWRDQWGFDTIWLCAPIRVWHTCNWYVLLAVHYIPDCPSTVISHRPTFHPQYQVKLCQPDVKCNKATPKGTRLHLRGNYSRQKTAAPILHCPVLSPDIVQLIGSTTVLVLYGNWHKRWREPHRGFWRLYACLKLQKIYIFPLSYTWHYLGLCSCEFIGSRSTGAGEGWK